MRVELDGIRHWRHDLTGCLHVAMGALLSFRGLDPLEVLGAAWTFRHRPTDIRREEYYFPGAAGSLLASLAPYHPVSSSWHVPPDAQAGWREVRAAVAAGVPVAVAADNFYLPFRPAYRDVHTNHLITVFGFDDENGTALVTDAVPPSFRGHIPVGVLTAARDSGNPIAGERDMFFTGNAIGNRWLEIEAGPDVPALTEDFAHHVIARNLAGFRESGDPAAYRGMDGQFRFLRDIADRLAAGDAGAIDEAFVVAGPTLAVTAVHADWLAMAGRTFEDPRLLEAARMVERVAHHWSAVRIVVATARPDPIAAASPLLGRADTLAADLERALGLLDLALAA